MTLKAAQNTDLPLIEAVCKAFHLHYNVNSRLMNWDLNPDCDCSWDDLPQSNKSVMRETISAFFANGVINREAVKEHLL